MSFEPKITSIPIGDIDTIETKVHETLLPDVVEFDLLESKTLFSEVIEPEEPQPYLTESLGPSSFFPLSQTEPIYLGPDDEHLPNGIQSIEEIHQEEPHPSTFVHWEGIHFYQTKPLLPPQT